jgi:hypothetical protein
MATNSTTQHTFNWQRDKHLRSGDRFWILTDVHSYEDSYYSTSEPQQLFRVGIYDLSTKAFGYATFGRDIARALLEAGMSPAPWASPLPAAIELHRAPHGPNPEGRFKVTATLLELPSDAAKVQQAARDIFRHFQTNATQGMWNDLAASAARNRAIRSAVDSMRPKGDFSASDIKEIVGSQVIVSPVLAELVEDGVLIQSGKKRGTRYRFASPKIVERVDWVD